MKDEQILRQTTNIHKNYPGLRDKNLNKLTHFSLGFHHAGMVRSDRNIV